MKITEKEIRQCECPCGSTAHPIPSPIRHNRLIIQSSLPKTTQRKAKLKQIKQNIKPRVWVPIRKESKRTVIYSGISLVQRFILSGQKENAVHEIGKLLFQDAINNLSSWECKEIVSLSEKL